MKTGFFQGTVFEKFGLLDGVLGKGGEIKVSSGLSQRKFLLTQEEFDRVECGDFVSLEFFEITDRPWVEVPLARIQLIEGKRPYRWDPTPKKTWWKKLKEWWRK